MKRTSIIALLLFACGSDDEHATELVADDRPRTAMPDPIDVCVEAESGALVAGRAEPSRAGIYDPAAPIDPTLLNWVVEGQGCVVYPGGSERRAPCGDPPAEHPVVARTLCGQ
jgi:hypothetical protein